MKRGLAGLLMAVLLFSLPVSAGAEAAAPGMKALQDVKRDSWYYGAVNFCVSRNLMVGMTSSRFEPNYSMTRAMLVQILYRMDGSPPSPRANFTDVAATSWYAPAVGWAATYGIVNGVDEKRFAPNEDITREQFATMLYRYLTYRGFSAQDAPTEHFTDEGDIAFWAREAMNWTVAAKLIQGFPDGSVRPKENAARSAAATMIARLFDNYLEPGCVDWSVLRSVNHRGYRITHPENTDIAYIESANQGFSYVETDLQLTRDRVPVCLHDTTINRMARNPDGTYLKETIPISSVTYRETMKYDFGLTTDTPFPGTALLTFENFLLICRGYRLSPYVEVKFAANWQTSDLQNLVSLVQRYGLEDSVTWISTSDALLAQLSDMMPEARVGYLVNDLTAEAVAAVKKLQNGRNEAFVDSATYSSEQIALCRAAGVPLEVWWTTDLEEKIAQLPRYVSGVTSNRYVVSEVRNQAARE